MIFMRETITEHRRLTRRSPRLRPRRDDFPPTSSEFAAPRSFGLCCNTKMIMSAFTKVEMSSFSLDCPPRLGGWDGDGGHSLHESARGHAVAGDSGRHRGPGAAAASRD